MLLSREMIIRTIPRVFSKLLSSRFEWKKKTGKTGGSQILGWMYAGGGGGHSDVYCVQREGWGGLKIRKKCVCN